MNPAGRQWLLLNTALLMTQPIGGHPIMRGCRRCCAPPDSPAFNALLMKFTCAMPIKIVLVLLSMNSIRFFLNELKIKRNATGTPAINHNDLPNLEVLYHGQQ